jgi:hypothetical protein
VGNLSPGPYVSSTSTRRPEGKESRGGQRTDPVADCMGHERKALPMDESSTLRLMAHPDTTPFICGTCPLSHPKHVGWLGIGATPYATFAAISYLEVPEVYVDVALGDMREGRFVASAIFGCRVGYIPENGAPGYEYTGSTILLKDPAHPLNVQHGAVDLHPRRDEFWRVVAWLAQSEDLVAEAVRAVAVQYSTVSASA